VHSKDWSSSLRIPLFLPNNRLRSLHLDEEHTDKELPSQSSVDLRQLLVPLLHSSTCALPPSAMNLMQLPLQLPLTLPLTDIASTIISKNKKDDEEKDVHHYHSYYYDNHERYMHSSLERLHLTAVMSESFMRYQYCPSVQSIDITNPRDSYRGTGVRYLMRFILPLPTPAASLSSPTLPPSPTAPRAFHQLLRININACDIVFALPSSMLPSLVLPALEELIISNPTRVAARVGTIAPLQIAMAARATLKTLVVSGTHTFSSQHMHTYTPTYKS
jgi:hypothetical protein